jgi:hypothetical protein
MAAMLVLRLRTAASLILLASAGVGLLPAVSAGQSLADVARKEEERRKTVQRPDKVYTNKDLSGTAAAAPAAAPAPEATAAADTAKDTKAAANKQAKDTSAKDQAYWSGRMKALKDKLERDTTFADALQSKVNSLTTDVVNRDDPAQRAALERDRQKSASQLAALQKEVAIGKKAIADLQEEARRGGVPPGWLR